MLEIMIHNSREETSKLTFPASLSHDCIQATMLSSVLTDLVRDNVI